MVRTLAGLGIVAAIAAAAMAMGYGPGGGPDVYTLRVVGNSSSGYDIVDSDKPLWDVYRVGFNGVIHWEFVNQTGERINIGLRDWEVMSGSGSCGVRFTQGGGPGRCEATLVNVQVGTTRPVVAVPQAGSNDDLANPYSFNIYVGLAPEGPMTRIDPELQIDDFMFTLPVIITALVAAALLVTALWLARRRRHPRR